MLTYITKFLNKFSINRCICCEYYIDWDKFFCDKCRRSLRASGTSGAIQCAFYYEFPVDNLISKFKFMRHYNIGVALTNILADILTEKFKNTEKPEALIFIPMHKKKLKQRGFNHAEFIANILGKKFNIPVLKNDLIKIENTKSQHKSTKREREQNLKNSFRLIKKINYKHIAIVDDVITTGATVKEVEKTLRRSGVVEVVEVWGLARV